MKLPHEEANCRAILQKCSLLFEAAGKIWDIASGLMADGTIFGRGNVEAVNVCLAGVYAKQMCSFYAAVTLCQKGLGKDAEQHLRSMFQAFYNLKAMEISTDVPEFARLWILWDIANTGRQADLIEKTKPELGVGFVRMRKELAPHRAEMGAEEWKTFIKNGPTKLNLAAHADFLDRGIQGGNFRESYDAFYPQASSSHGYDLAEFVLPMEGGGLQVNLSPTDKHVEAVVVSAIAFLRDSMAVLNALLKLGKDMELAAMTEIVESVRPKSPPPVAGGPSPA